MQVKIFITDTASFNRYFSHYFAAFEFISEYAIVFFEQCNFGIVLDRALLSIPSPELRNLSSH